MRGVMVKPPSLFYLFVNVFIKIVIGEFNVTCNCRCKINEMTNYLLITDMKVLYHSQKALDMHL